MHGRALCEALGIPRGTLRSRYLRLSVAFAMTTVSHWVGGCVDEEREARRGNGVLYVAAGGDHGGGRGVGGGEKARAQGRGGKGLEARGLLVGVEVDGLVLVALLRCVGSG